MEFRSNPDPKHCCFKGSVFIEASQKKLYLLFFSITRQQKNLKNHQRMYRKEALVWFLRPSKKNYSSRDTIPLFCRPTQRRTCSTSATWTTRWRRKRGSWAAFRPSSPCSPTRFPTYTRTLAGPSGKKNYCGPFGNNVRMIAGLFGNKKNFGNKLNNDNKAFDNKLNNDCGALR